MLLIKKIQDCFEFESLVWIVGLLFLALSDPYSSNHFNLFLPSYLFDIQSPGYGLGHSISHFFHGNFIDSFKTHPLGIITVVALMSRSFYLIRKSYLNSIKKGQL